MFIMDPDSIFFHLKKISDPEKNVSKLSKYDPRCSTRLRILIFLPIPDPGIKRAPDPRSGYATLLVTIYKLRE
jgi:hypothetical protein